MAAQRAYSAAATVGGRIFIAGGMNESNRVDGFEVFDPHRPRLDGAASAA